MENQVDDIVCSLGKKNVALFWPDKELTWQAVLDTVGGSVRAANFTDWSFRTFCLSGSFFLCS